MNQAGQDSEKPVANQQEIRDMNGLIVFLEYFDGSCFRPTVETSAGCSVFMSLFSDILSHLAPYYWICPDSPFSSNYAKDDNELDFFYSSLSAESDDVYEPYSFFPEYARWVRDDSNWLFGFVRKPEKRLVEKLYKESYAPDSPILKDAYVIFCNEDAAYWECYARNSDLLDKCRLSVRKKVSDEYVRFLNLSERESFYRTTSEGSWVGTVCGNCVGTGCGGMYGVGPQ